MIRHLLIAALGIAISAPAMAQQEMLIADGDQIPNLRPCVDYAGRGALRTVGEPIVPDIGGNPGDSNVIILMDAIYSFRFDERAILFGEGKGGSVTLTKSYHSHLPIDIGDALVLTAGRRRVDRMVVWQWVWRDRAGRPFVPIFSWPDPARRGRNWMPLAIRRFAKPVRYNDPQPYWPGALSDREFADDEPELFGVKGKRVIVRYGLYLGDIPALFEAAKAETCWR